ncbi:MAG: hypothetical protein HOO06_10505 [Bdellovibrionaceae bacterium]|jgi:hypothetical protein|nr:hypothetical protein [Pseudobdellovibrionaceae bacterium]
MLSKGSLLKIICGAIIFVWSFSVAAKNISLKASTSKLAYKGFVAKAKPYWQNKSKDKKLHFSLKTKLIWPAKYKVKAIINFSKDLSVIRAAKIKGNQAIISLRHKKSKLKVFLTNGKKFTLVVEVQASEKNYFIANNCIKYSLLFLPTKKIQSGYFAGMSCSLVDSNNKPIDVKKEKTKKKVRKGNKKISKKSTKKKNKAKNKKKKSNDIQKVRLVLSTFLDANLESSIFEVEGKGENTRIYEFQALHGVVAINGKLGTFSWGKVGKMNTVGLVNNFKYFLKKKSKELNSFHDNRHVGIGVSTINLTKDLKVVDNQGVFLNAESSGVLGSTKFGYFVTASILTMVTDETANVDYSSLSVLGAYWFYLGNSTLGPLVGMRWLDMRSTGNNFGANIQAPSMGIAFESPLFSAKNKTYINLMATSVAGEIITGSEIQFQFMQDFTLWSQKFFVGLDFNSLSLENSSDLSTIDSTISGLTMGLNF